MPEIAKTNRAAGLKTGVLLLDDQPIVRERLAEIIADEPDLVVAGEADDAHEAMRLVAAAKPGLIVTGLSLRNAHGLDFIKDLRAQHPGVRILVFSMYDELVYAERAIRAGAQGFIRKQERTDELRRAIRSVLNGAVYLSERVTVAKVTRFFTPTNGSGGSPVDTLSDRELQVLQLIGQGQTTSQIAGALHVDVKTIETYRARIKVKLKLDGSASLAQHAARWLEQSTRHS